MLKKQINRRGRLFWGSNVLIFSLLFFADRITKYIALHRCNGQQVDITSFMNMQLEWNRGVTWGILSASSWVGYLALVFVIALIITIFSLYTFFQFRAGEPVLSELFVLAGAISNFFDRLYYGAVIDFIDIHTVFFTKVGLDRHWPTFNLADLFILIGVGGIIIRGFYGRRKSIVPK